MKSIPFVCYVSSMYPSTSVFSNVLNISAMSLSFVICTQLSKRHMKWYFRQDYDCALNIGQNVKIQSLSWPAVNKTLFPWSDVRDCIFPWSDVDCIFPWSDVKDCTLDSHGLT